MYHGMPWCYGQDEQDAGRGILPNTSDDGTCATCADVTGETGGQMLTPPPPGVPAMLPAEVPSSAVSPGGEEGGGPGGGPCNLSAPWWAWLAGGLVLGHFAARRRQG